MVDRYNVALYHKFEDDKKNQWWLVFDGRSYADIDETSRKEMMAISHQVHTYVNANEQKREYLWHRYDFMTRGFCDTKRWNDELKKEEQLERYARRLFPKAEISIIIK